MYVCVRVFMLICEVPVRRISRSSLALTSQEPEDRVLHMRAVAVDAEGPGLQRGRVGRASDSAAVVVAVVLVRVVVPKTVFIICAVTGIGIDRVFALATCRRQKDPAQLSDGRGARGTFGDSKG